MLRRGVECILAGLGLLVLLPILVLVMIVIILFERSSPFYIQERLGLNKREFKIYKLRTMLNGEITLLGRILRKTGIDEIPQLINILRGDMSFVGPRPLLESDIVRLKWTGDYYAKRWSVRPGITGLAQLGSKCHKKFTWIHDRYYVDHTSFCLDLKIVCLSLGIPILGKARVKKLIHN